MSPADGLNTRSEESPVASRPSAAPDDDAARTCREAPFGLTGALFPLLYDNLVPPRAATAV